jgi:hypothetical protein
MKQRIRLSILMLWSFMHFLLFAFNGFKIKSVELTSDFYTIFKILNYRNFMNDVKYVGIFNANFWSFYLENTSNYDVTEFLVYVITPIFFLCIYNFIRFNQFRLIIK